MQHLQSGAFTSNDNGRHARRNAAGAVSPWVEERGVAMTELRNNEHRNAGSNKPRVVVSETDHQRLTELAAGAEERFPAVAEELAAEMDRADVVADGAVPAEVVRMGSTVVYRSDTGQERRVTLVFPPQADITANRISILTPIGTALIGLAPGHAIRWRAPDGREHALTVVSVEPPAAD